MRKVLLILAACASEPSLYDIEPCDTKAGPGRCEHPCEIPQHINSGECTATSAAFPDPVTCGSTFSLEDGRRACCALDGPPEAGGVMRLLVCEP